MEDAHDHTNVIKIVLIMSLRAAWLALMVRVDDNGLSQHDVMRPAGADNSPCHVTRAKPPDPGCQRTHRAIAELLKDAPPI